MSFNTIHVFGYGETQIIGDKNGKVKNSDLTSLSAFVNYIKGFRPSDVEDADVHVIHIFNGNEVRYLGKGTGDFKKKYSFSVKWADLDLATLNALVTEVESKVLF